MSSPSHSFDEPPEPDCTWPPEQLDLEPEPLWCLPHGCELPCPRCCAAAAKCATEQGDDE